MNLGISALLFFLMAGCGQDDDVWSGASGWAIGVLIGIFLLVGILALAKTRK